MVYIVTTIDRFNNRPFIDLEQRFFPCNIENCSGTRWRPGFKHFVCARIER